MSNPTVFLVIWHSRTGASERMAHAIAEAGGAKLVRAYDVTSDMLTAATGYVFVCPENLGALSGEMKEMFDRVYYDVLGLIEGRAYATVIAAGSDGEGAQRQLDRIVTGWRLKRVMEPKIVNFAAQEPEDILATKSVPAKVLKECENIGRGFEEGLKLGLF
ncbi:flavodoxin family protein [Erythrobacter crassostreae]|uniref:NAD(P)H-dependent oxidoreductase n=1 Tax=Erythrobacter crassostreae TaxID=2828328 RepID=A0A9X1F5G9_9SPHN|nr:NAD(P)H-dependent oxidoreductase [Erythrobacter crassostrea]MBV7259858.1 NAD(P)H-dependent oxidoreductase [Erythrobacter crassostrea]